MENESKRKAEDPSTEARILEAARMLFQGKGYAGTRTRDIAKAAGINLALLNYYFRSKERLFHRIMLESVQRFFQTIQAVLNDEETTLFQKIEAIPGCYADLLAREPEMPLFLLSEIRHNPDNILEPMDLRGMMARSCFLRQFRSAVAEGRIPEMHPVQFLLNLVGMTVFPYLAKPMIQVVTSLDEQTLDSLIRERRQLIPTWIAAAHGFRQEKDSPGGG
jgi:AcrR family transcriptional regulator